MVTTCRIHNLYKDKWGKPPKLNGIVFDESKAYRGIGVALHHLRYSVIVVKCPEGGVKFFIMNSMMFGSKAAVPNYNRRAMLLTLLLRKLFLIPLYNYYDDIFAVETEDTANSALE